MRSHNLFWKGLYAAVIVHTSSFRLLATYCFSLALDSPPLSVKMDFITP